jgi:hypothetical protein
MCGIRSETTSLRIVELRSQNTIANIQRMSFYLKIAYSPKIK